MRTVAALLVGSLVSGCMVLPRTRRDLIATRVERTDERVEALGPKLVDGRFAGATVTARAVQARWCHAAARTVSTYRVHEGARMSWPDVGGDAYVGVFVLMFSIVTLPASAIVTGITVAASDDHTEEVVTALPDRGAACDLPLAGASVWLTITGGTIERAVSGDDGRVQFTLDRAVRRDQVRLGLDQLGPPRFSARAAAR